MEFQYLKEHNSYELAFGFNSRIIMLGSYVWLDRKTCSCVSCVLPDFSVIIMITKKGNLDRRPFLYEILIITLRIIPNMYRLLVLEVSSIYVHDIKSLTLNGEEHGCGVKDKLLGQIHTIPCSFQLHCCYQKNIWVSNK